MKNNAYLPENVFSVSTIQGGWKGVRFDVTSFQCIGDAALKLHQSGASPEIDI